MYAPVLFLHSWLRWLVLLFAIIAIARAIGGAASRRPWTPSDDLAGKLFIRTFDLQVLLGIVLYLFLSPITAAAMADFGGAMADSQTRFWAVEHVFGMVVALVLAHRGRMRVRAIQDPGRKHKVAAIFFILALVALAASIPWPGTPYWRPLLRWG